jgi:uncharacterized protein (DUF952 family)
MIFHVTTSAGWKQALEQGSYQAESLALEGFIHCSKQSQLTGVLERYYKNQTGLVLLHIDESKVTAPLQYDFSPSVNEEFPHIYGPLNLDAIDKTEAL